MSEQQEEQEQHRKDHTDEPGGGGGTHPHPHEAGHHEQRKFYYRPIQRQKWDDPQVLPHKDWGAVFFDLFYVAAAYNLGNVIRYEPTSRGVFYFAGFFCPMMFVWIAKMSFDARYVVGDDVVHRVYEYCILVALGTAVLFIRPVEIVENPNNYDLFVYSLSMTICHILSMGRMVEVRVFAGSGCQPGAKKAASRDLKWYTIGIVWMIVATVVSGVAFYGSDNNNQTSSSSSSSSSSSYPGTDYPNDGTMYPTSLNDTITTAAAIDEHHDSNVASGNHTDHRFRYRILAESTTTGAGTTTSDYNSNNYYSESLSSVSTQQTDITVWLLIAAGVGYQLLLGVMILCLPKDGKHKEIAVPMHIEFCIHRWGELVMVMLGESVLSLLIVIAPETGDYYTTFFCGIVSITMLEYLHFRSQPHDPNDHAMRRSKEAGIAFNYLMFIYCGALIILGVSYKMLLNEFVYEAQTLARATGHRSLLLGNSSNSILGRLLAGGGADVPKYDTTERRQMIANLFSGSMTVVWLCSDLMILTHGGIKAHLQKCTANNRTFPMRVFGMGLLFVRIGMLAFVATLSQYFTEPEGLAIIGLCGIGFQVILRVIGTSLYGPIFESHDPNNDPDDDSQNMWPNVTRPEVADDSVTTRWRKKMTNTRTR